jgi:hypothetical protein
MNTGLWFHLSGIGPNEKFHSTEMRCKIMQVPVPTWQIWWMPSIKRYLLIQRHVKAMHYIHWSIFECNLLRNIQNYKCTHRYLWVPNLVPQLDERTCNLAFEFEGRDSMLVPFSLYAQLPPPQWFHPFRFATKILKDFLISSMRATCAASPSFCIWSL